MVWNDCETSADLLNYQCLVKTVVGLIKDSKRLTPLTIGIHGDWGSGKSSVLKMIDIELAPIKQQKLFAKPEGDLPKVVCLRFNGWLFQGFDDAKSALMTSIIEELVQLQPWNEKLKKQAAALVKKVNWLKVARTGAGLAWTAVTGMPDPSMIGSVVGQFKQFVAEPGDVVKKEDIEKSLEQVSEYIKDEKAPSSSETIHEFRTKFKELLETAGVKQLVVLVDDLDRCLPDTAIETLEAIRLFLDVQGSTFVIATDESMIEYAVRRHFPNLPVSVGPADFTRNYLEKLIQIPIRLPQLGKVEARNYIALLLCEYSLKENPEKFQKIVKSARNVFQRPWQNEKLNAEFVKKALAVDVFPGELSDPLLVAERIGPILSEGLKGNPRQIKRFLNTLMVRMRSAEAYGMADLVKLPLLAKLMLLERFEPAVFQEIAELSAQEKNGKCDELRALEEHALEADSKAEKPSANSKSKPSVKAKESDDGNGKGEKATVGTRKATKKARDNWLNKSWVVGWAKILPTIGDLDLRPYLFVSREKSPRFVGTVGLDQKLEELGDVLTSGNSLRMNSIKSDIAALNEDQANSVFDYVSEIAKQQDSWLIQPESVKGLLFLCSERPKLTQKVIQMFDSLPTSTMGLWAPMALRRIIKPGASEQDLTKLEDKWLKEGSPQLQQSVTHSRSLTKGG